MKKVYPVLIKEDKDGKGYLVYIPDFNNYTEGKDFADAMYMARDAISMLGICNEDAGKALPEASDYQGAIRKAKEKADDVFDYSDGIVTMIDVDLEEYRRRHSRKMVRRNVTLPSWLDFEAKKAKINVSGVLQQALMEVLGL